MKQEIPIVAIQTACEIYGTLIRNYNIPARTVINTISAKLPDLLSDPFVLTVMAHDDTIDDLIENIRKGLQNG